MKKIIEHLDAEWYKYLLEILVITTGILGAFALNNWNDTRKEEVEREKLIELLKQELTTNVKFLNNRIEKWNQPILDKLDSIIQDKYPLLEDEDFVEAIGTLIGFPPSVPNTPVLDAVLNSDVLKSSEQVLFECTELSHQIGFIQNSEDFINEFYNREISPFCNENGLNIAFYKFYRTNEIHLNKEQRESVRSTHFKNLLVTKSFLVRDWVMIQRSSLNKMKELQEILAKE